MDIKAPPHPQKRKRPSISDDADLPAKNQAHLASALNLDALPPPDIAALEFLPSRYHVQSHSVLSSSKIQNRVTAILRHVDAYDPNDFAKPPLSVLHARAPDANKLIAIAEIAKREMARPSSSSSTTKTAHWFQYMTLGEQVVERPRDAHSNSQSVVKDTMLGSTAGSHEDGEGDESGDFETIKTRMERAVEGRPVVRGVPMVSLFLCRTSVDVLKRLYGEQSNTI